MSKEAYYFSHDANARHDPKILALRSIYGIQGYGIYWVIIEMLREQEDYQLPKKEYIYNAIAMQVQCKDFAKEDAKQFVQDCINEFDLLHENNDFIYAKSLLKRMEKKNDLSEKRRAAAKARWNKTNDTNDEPDDEDANAKQMDANAKQTDARKGKESKEKEKKYSYDTHVTLTRDEYQKLIDKFGEPDAKERIERLSLYKGSKGKKYKSDYMTILQWAKREEPKAGTVGAGSKFDGVSIGDE
jgi:hypothetical protein